MGVTNPFQICQCFYFNLQQSHCCSLSRCNYLPSIIPWQHQFLDPYGIVDPGFDQLTLVSIGFDDIVLDPYWLGEFDPLVIDRVEFPILV